MVPSANGNELHTNLRAPAATAWEILTCREGARLWLIDESRGGLEVGARIPVRGAGMARVVAVTAPERIELKLDDGSDASIEIRPVDGNSSKLVLTRNDVEASPAVGWRHLVESAAIIVSQAQEVRAARQAVVVIHGIGSQRPLATMRRLGDALVDRSERWNKPDRLSSSFELHRHQLRRTRRRPRTDIYELYWADKVPGTALGHIGRWLGGQVLRRPRDVSPALRPLLYLCFAALVLAVVALVVLVVVLGVEGVSGLWATATGIAGLSLVTGLVSGVLVKTVGDAARYLDDAPENIEVRESIREAGVALLRRLHDEGSYDRVVLVAHSLGSVIAYDLIRHFWSEVHREHGRFVAPAQPALKAYLARVDGATTDMQKALWEENRRLGIPWLITDLITLGSPLTHATSVLARSAADLEERRRELQLPTCPPRPDGKEFTMRSSYVVDGVQRTIKLLAHGCPFATTRWTNIYAPVRGWFFGDVVGGPVKPEFGGGVRDVAVRVEPRWRRRTLLAHLAYWRPGEPATELLRAIDLDSASWLGRHVGSVPWSVTLSAAESELRRHIVR